MKVQVFLHLYPEEGREDEGEYITYQGEFQNGTEFRLFLDSVEADWVLRSQLVNEGKSILTAEVREG